MAEALEALEDARARASGAGLLPGGPEPGPSLDWPHRDGPLSGGSGSAAGGRSRPSPYRCAARRPERAARGVIRPGARAQRLVRADQRVHGPARRRARAEGARRDPGARRSGRCTPRSLTLPRPMVIRLKTYVRIPRDAHRRKITRRAVFARDQLDLPVLRPGARQPHGRPRDPALEGRRLGLGQHRHLLRAVQPAQGRPAPAPGQHGPAHEARAPGSTVFIHVAAPVIPQAWEQYLSTAA